MDTLDMFQARIGKLNEFGWGDLEMISVNAGMLFTSTEFMEECKNCIVQITLEALEHQ